MDAIKKGKGLVILVLFMVLTMIALGRPGGGHSFGGGSSSGGGGYSGGGGWSGSSRGSEFSSSGSFHFSTDGDGGLIIIVILVGLAFAVYMFVNNRPVSAGQGDIYSSATSESRQVKLRQTQSQLAALRERDRGFSEVLFLEWAQLLYTQYHSRRGEAEMAHLRPLLGDEAWQKYLLLQNKGVKVSEVVIGGLRIVDVKGWEDQEVMVVSIDGNLTETAQTSRRFVTADTWVFSRKRGIQSKGPEAMFSLGCPSCGASLAQDQDGACQYCGQVVVPGTLTWKLHMVQERHTPLGQVVQFGHYAAEQGTSLPTAYAPGLAVELLNFAKRHHIENGQLYFTTAVDQIVKPSFLAIYKAWDAGDYTPVRLLMGDQIYRSHQYWLSAYATEGYRNRLKNLEVRSVELARLQADEHYEAATFRIFARVLDYVEDKQGRTVGGSDKMPRIFSEYWTFIRRMGVEKPLEDTRLDACPNCGAPVQVGAVGICTHCQAKVTTGDFGWVLSSIVQDEVYS